PQEARPAMRWLSEQTRGIPQIHLTDASQPRHIGDAVGLDERAPCVKPLGPVGDKGVVPEVLVEDHARETVEQGYVGAWQRAQPDVGDVAQTDALGVDNDQMGPRRYAVAKARGYHRMVGVRVGSRNN